MVLRGVNARLLSVVVGALLMFALTLAFANSASAHGYVSKPESRGLLCKTGANIDCGGVQYEPQSLETAKGFPEAGPADGNIAGANTFPKLDEQSKYRWTKVAMKSGANTFQWDLTARHSTTKWEYFITKPGWNPDAPLKRADLELFHTTYDGGKRPEATVTHNVNVPERSGYHIILAVWTVDDTPNAFYNVIDANFDGTTVPPVDPDPVDPDPVDPDPNTGTWVSSNAYVGGDTVTYNGSTYKAKWWTQGDTPGSAAVWELVNGSGGGDGGGTPDPTVAAWSESKVYLNGDKVTLDSVLYQAKWWTQGENPSSSSVWMLVN